MRKLTALFLAILCVNLWGQPVNDLCVNAIEIDLATVSPCPASDLSVATVSGNNISASPSSPLIQLTADFGNGAQLSAPVADVWFSFTPTANRINIQIEGMLSDPVMVLFVASQCGEKIPVALSSQNDAGSLQATVVPGQPYRLMVAGGDINDQDSFSIKITNFNDCSTCGKRQGSLRAEPAPENGTYQAGQEIQFCLSIESWDPGFMLEWLHAIQLDFGNGWDLSSLAYTAPDACTPGSWSWYDSWIGCNTGQNFGPGFAFDAEQGLLCPGAAPYDGLPGNNFGDGPCGTLEAAPLPLEFCFSLKVKDNFSSTEEANLNIKATLLGDGYSGSWMQYSCTDEAATFFLASAVPAMALLPELIIVNDACANLCDGQLNIVGQGNSSWQYALYDENDVMVYSAPAFNGQDVVDSLCPGDYEFELSQLNGTLSQRVPLHVPEANLPDLQVGHLPACNEGEAFQLVAGINAPIANTTFNWSGPDNFNATSSSPQAEIYGTYTLQAAVNGCLLPEKSINIQPMRSPVYCEPKASSITFSWEQLPVDTAYDVLVVTGQSGSWIDDHTYQVEGLSPEEVVEIEVMISGTGFCSTSVQYADCISLSCEPPAITEQFISCSGSGVSLFVDDSNLETISWSPSATLSCSDCPSPIASPVSTTSYEVTTTSIDGCISTQVIEVLVDNLPEEVLPDEPVPFCPGESFEYCLPSENDYLWISPMGFIKLSDCLVFPYTNENITGEYLIQVRLPNGCQFYESLTIYPACEGSSAGDESSALDLQLPPAGIEPIQIYPNPTSELLHLDFPEETPREITLYALTGEQVMKVNSMDLNLQVNLAGLSAGTYVLSVRGAAGVWQEKVIVTR
jgi:hypothetical protein